MIFCLNSIFPYDFHPNTKSSTLSSLLHDRRGHRRGVREEGPGRPDAVLVHRPRHRRRGAAEQQHRGAGEHLGPREERPSARLHEAGVPGGGHREADQRQAHRQGEKSPFFCV